MDIRAPETALLVSLSLNEGRLCYEGYGGNERIQAHSRAGAVIGGGAAGDNRCADPIHYGGKPSAAGAILPGGRGLVLRRAGDADVL